MRGRVEACAPWVVRGVHRAARSRVGALRGCRFVVRTRDRQPCLAPRSPSPCSDRSSRPRERGAPSRGLPRAPVDSCPSCRERMRGGLRRSAPGDAPRASGARRDRGRVQRLLLIPAASPRPAATDHPVARVTPAWDRALRDLQAGGATTENGIWLVDPRRFVVSYFPAGAGPGAIKQDLVRLLKYSRWQTG